MSTDAALRERSQRPSLRALGGHAFRIVFGDSGGALVFCLAIAAAIVLWRFQFTINDNVAIANGLAAVADGHLRLEDAVYGPLDAPGVVAFDGRPYPRNVGHIAFAVPFLLVIRLLTRTMGLQVMAGTLWSLAILGAFVAGGHRFGHLRTGKLVGSAGALLAFATTLAFAEPVHVDGYALVALQLSTLVVAGFTCVLVYRLLALAQSRRVGLAAALGIALATPALFWATVPKRHVPTAALAAVSLYFLYRSRAATSESTYRRFRMLAYVPVGLTAWVFVGEGALLFLALGVVDTLSARENGVRSLLGVGAALVVGFIPFFVTNYLISGDPLTSPMMLPGYTSGMETGSGTGPTTTGTSSGSLRGADGDTLLPPTVQQLLYFLDQYVRGLEVAISETDRVTQVFVRSGWSQTVSRLPEPTITVAVLESMPLAGALAGIPIVAVRRLRRLEFDPIHAVDVFVALYAVLTVLLYLPRMPDHAQFTMRYLYPVFPFAAYGVARLPAVRAVLRARSSLLGWTYAVAVLLGSQLTLAAFVLLDAAVEELIRGLAGLGLTLAVLLAVWSVLSTITAEGQRVGAVVLGIAAAAGTNFLLIVTVYYLGSDFALPVVPNL